MGRKAQPLRKGRFGRGEVGGQHHPQPPGLVQLEEPAAAVLLWSERWETMLCRLQILM